MHSVFMTEFIGMGRAKIMINYEQEFRMLYRRQRGLDESDFTVAGRLTYSPSSKRRLGRSCVRICIIRRIRRRRMLGIGLDIRYDFTKVV
jgi:hypothetical protein